MMNRLLFHLSSFILHPSSPMAINSYTLTTLWHDRQRFLPGVLAVTFSAALINLQCGLLLGLFSTTSIPIDHTAAEIWMSAPGVLSVDLGRPVSQANLSRMASWAEVEAPEILLLDYSYWLKPDGSKELCIVIGSRLLGHPLGAVEELTEEMRGRLTEPGAIIVDEAELGRLGIKGIGDRPKIGDTCVRIVGLVRGLKSLTGPYVFCSIETARMLLPGSLDQATYLLARCRQPGTASAVVERLRTHSENLSAFTKEEFSRRTRVHWLTQTNAGISTAFTAALGLLVGAVITSQSLYAAVAASMREYAVLRALGIPRRRINALVLALSFWVGMVGIVLAFPTTSGLAHVAEILGTHMLLPYWLLGSVTIVTMAMAIFSGLAALRSLRLTEPANLLR
jgi:putative ABC transport system permease protein